MYINKNKVLTNLAVVNRDMEVMEQPYSTEEIIKRVDKIGRAHV